MSVWFPDTNSVFMSLRLYYKYVFIRLCQVCMVLIWASIHTWQPDLFLYFFFYFSTLLKMNLRHYRFWIHLLSRYVTLALCYGPVSRLEMICFKYLEVVINLYTTSLRLVITPTKMLICARLQDVNVMLALS